MRGLTRYDLGLLIVSLIWGGNYSVTKQALAHVGPIPFAAMRFVVSSLLLVMAARWLDGDSVVPSRTRRRLLALGIVGHTFNQIAFVGGLSLTTATNSALIFASQPVAVAVMGTALGHERLPRRVWLAVLLGTAGVVIVVAARGVQFSAATFRGDLLSVLGMLLWASFTVGMRWAADGVGSVRAAMFTHLGGTPGLMLAALPGAGPALSAAQLPAVWGALLYSAVGSSLIAMVLWTRSLKALGGSRTALYSCLTPLFAGATAWLVLGERPLPVQGVGAAFVVAGVLLSAGPAAAPVRVPGPSAGPPRSGQTPGADAG